MLQPDGERLAAAHREADDAAVRGVLARAIVRDDKWHRVLQQVAFEGGGVGVARAGRAGRDRVTVEHHNDHRLRALLRD